MITEDYVSFETAKLLKEKGFDGPCHMVWYKTANSKQIVSAPQFVEGEIVTTRDSVDAAARDMIYPYSFENGVEGFLAPTLQMAMKWLREEKDVQIEIAIVGTDTWESPTKWMYGFRCQTKDVIDRRNADFSSYEEACEAAIKYCLEKLI